MLFLVPVSLAALALFFAVRPAGAAADWRRDWPVVLGLLGGAVVAHHVARFLGLVPVGPLRLIGGGVPRGVRGLGYAAAVAVFAWQAAADARERRSDAPALGALALVVAGVWLRDLGVRTHRPADGDDDDD